MSGVFPRNYPASNDVTRITVSHNRHPRSIAADLTRRLLNAYQIEINTANQRRDAQKKIKNTQALIATTAMTIVNSNGGNLKSYESAFSKIPNSIELRGAINAGELTVFISKSGGGDVHLSTNNNDTLLNILALLTAQNL